MTMHVDASNPDLITVDVPTHWYNLAAELSEPIKNGFADSMDRVFLAVSIMSLLAILGTAAASPVLARPFLVAVGAAYARAFGAVGRLAGLDAPAKALAEEVRAGFASLAAERG